MRGDSIVIEPHHKRAAEGICKIILPSLRERDDRFVLTVAGESGSGKSETAAAVAEQLAQSGIQSYIFQQDDYFVYPPKSNDQARRKDINWVGPNEVKLDLLDEHLNAFRNGAKSVKKPLVVYADDSVEEELAEFGDAQVAIAEGTYTTLLNQVNAHAFIDRDFEQTRAHREKRRRDAAELDPFIDKVLTIEHDIISKNKSRADIIVHDDYSVSPAN